MISGFFISLVKVSRSLSHFGIFIANEEEGVSQLSLSHNLTKEKNWAIKRPDAHAQGAFMLCLYYYVKPYTYTMMHLY